MPLPIGVNRTLSSPSLAAPYALRQAVAIRSLLGSELSPLSIRALLIHGADSNDQPADEVGWGKVPENLDDVVASPDGVGKIVYQGEVAPGKYIRAKVPVPTNGFTGMVTVKATFCFASPVDIQSPDVYTRAALEPVFRPDLTKFAKDSNTPKSRSFFTTAPFTSEDVLRSAEGKWETTLHAEDRMRGATLQSPVFDIHYNARDAGGQSSSKEPIQYALVISLEAPRHSGLHEDILEAYADVLVPIEPDIDIELPEN